MEPVAKISCDDSNCLVTPENPLHLPNMIGSNTVVVMDGEVLSVDERYGFVNIDSVSNLTIMGLPEQ